ncbi:MAG: hypothetical protein WD534_09940 [Phycisphaeraceae bacterium]
MTLRELVAMAEAKSRDQWNHTAAVLALIANCHRDPKKTGPFKAEQFHPLAEKPEPVKLKDKNEAFAILKHVFVDLKKKDPPAGTRPNRRASGGRGIEPDHTTF